MKWLLCRAGEHVSALDGAKYLVITDVQPGQQAQRSAPQLEPGLLLKEVNGISVRDFPTNEVMGMMGQRPLDLVFVREGGMPHGGGDSSEAAARLTEELTAAKRERDDIDQDAQRVLQHMYRMEEELETLREDNERLMQERTDAQGQVSRHDIAAIWVAFFSRWRRYRC